MNSSRVFLGSFIVLFALIFIMSRRDGDESIDTLHIYCAANMRKPIREIAEKYKEKYKVTINADYDGSGSLLAKLQIVDNYADLYLSADDSYI